MNGLEAVVAIMFLVFAVIGFVIAVQSIKMMISNLNSNTRIKIKGY